MVLLPSQNGTKLLCYDVNARNYSEDNAGLKSSSAKVPWQWAPGAVRLSARPIWRSAGWPIGLKTAPEGPVVKGIVDEVFSPSITSNPYTLPIEGIYAFDNLASKNEFLGFVIILAKTIVLIHPIVRFRSIVTMKYSSFVTNQVSSNTQRRMGFAQSC